MEKAYKYIFKIPVYCWHCGNKFYIEIANVKAGKLFCSDKCREENWKNEIKMEKERGGEKIEIF